MKTSKKIKLVYIEWEDAVDDTSTGWKTMDECLDWEKKSRWIVHQTGYVIKENKECVIMANKMEPGTEEYLATFKGITRIPKTWIHKRKEIKI